MACWSKIEGTWSYREMIGAKFRVKSLPLSVGGKLQKGCGFRYSNMILTLKDVYFRASTDGKVIPLFRMEEVCGRLFLPRDLELLEVNKIPGITSICGEFDCGRVPVGNGIIAEKPLIPKPEEDTTITTTTKAPIVPEEKPDNGIISGDIDDWEIIIL